MALLSTCVKCGSTNFETKEASPSGSNYKFMFVQCARCGGVVGVTDFFNTAALLRKLAKKLGVGNLA
jgi:predicted nucleic-acid-binding Zn-ribbon protein